VVASEEGGEPAAGHDPILDRALQVLKEEAKKAA
jgi:hypothetical protein